MYAIRITRSYDEIKDWVNALEADKMIVYEHSADHAVTRTHIHMLLVNSKLKPDAMKARYKKLYNTIDKADWSFKSADADYEKYITYMSKGKLQPLVNKGIENVDDLMSQWKDPRTQNLKLIQGRLVRDVNKTPKKTRRELVELMISRMDDGMTIEKQFGVIRKVLIEHNEVIGQYKAIEYYDACMMYGDGESWIASCVRKINSRDRI